MPKEGGLQGSMCVTSAQLSSLVSRLSQCLQQEQSALPERALDQDPEGSYSVLT